MHPARSWREAVDITTTLYEEARADPASATEKFMLDGRHIGTGGGNHIVLGGIDAGRQPVAAPAGPAGEHDRLLAEPPVAVLPVLGPVHRADQPVAARRRGARTIRSTSWRSRCARCPEPGDGTMPPWLVDRLFRNLLVDVTGNTHRAEICIDKLYSPDGPTGRLGLVEFRAFEMPPHARMSLAQQLLVRALVARFWESPTGQAGALGHRAARPLHAAAFRLGRIPRASIADLRECRLRARCAWFAPHIEFRFPALWRGRARGMSLACARPSSRGSCSASGGGAGTVRTVDSSLNRVQVTVRGMNADRYVVTCNGYRLPIVATRKSGKVSRGYASAPGRRPRAFIPRSRRTFP